MSEISVTAGDIYTHKNFSSYEFYIEWQTDLAFAVEFVLKHEDTSPPGYLLTMDLYPLSSCCHYSLTAENKMLFCGFCSAPTFFKKAGSTALTEWKDTYKAFYASPTSIFDQWFLLLGLPPLQALLEAKKLTIYSFAAFHKTLSRLPEWKTFPLIQSEFLLKAE